jgi:hypothetical protein
VLHDEHVAAVVCGPVLGNTGRSSGAEHARASEGRDFLAALRSATYAAHLTLKM